MRYAVRHAPVYGHGGGAEQCRERPELERHRMDAKQSQGKILVTGATGNVGGAVVAGLVARGVPVRALVRDENKARGLVEAGVEIVIGDLEQPDTLDAAFRGVDRVFLVTPVGPDAPNQARNAIAAARRTGSPHIVRLGAFKSSADSPTIVGRLHAETDADLKSSGLPYTILRQTDLRIHRSRTIPGIRARAERRETHGHVVCVCPEGGSVKDHLGR